MVFKKWVDYLLKFNLVIAFFLLAAFEFENLTTQIVVGVGCLSIILINSLLLDLYGR